MIIINNFICSIYSCKLFYTLVASMSFLWVLQRVALLVQHI